MQALQSMQPMQDLGFSRKRSAVDTANDMFPPVKKLYEVTYKKKIFFVYLSTSTSPVHIFFWRY